MRMGDDASLVPTLVPTPMPHREVRPAGAGLVIIKYGVAAYNRSRVENTGLSIKLPFTNQPYENHKKWFLRNHENAIVDFDKTVEQQYPTESVNQGQLRLL